MRYRKLGKSNIQVSNICLGSMMWGSQCNEKQAFEQLDYALAQGINFIDTAELYAVPPRPDTSTIPPLQHAYDCLCICLGMPRQMLRHP